MNIADVIASLMGGQDPNRAVMSGANAAVPPSGPPPQQAPQQPPPSTAPEGVKSPVTNPRPAAEEPKVTQSPSDLANMYIQLMKQNQNAAALDSGMTLMAAGLSRNAANRHALIGLAGHGQGAGGMSLSANDLINFQKQGDAQRMMMIQQKALPALMKQYGWSPAQAQALFAGGKLDEVLSNYSTRTLGQVTDAKTGQTHLYDTRTGQPITTIGEEKVPEVGVAETYRGPVPYSKETGVPVAPPIGGEKPETGQFVAGPGGQVLQSQRIDPTKPAEPLGLPPTDTTRTDAAALAALNAEETAKGLPLTSMKEYLTKIKHSGLGTSLNIGTDGKNYPTPEAGHDYVRNDKGEVLVGPDGKVSYYKIPESTAADKAAALTKEEAKAAEKEKMAKSQAAFQAGNVGNAVKRAFEVADQPGASGFGSKIARNLDIFGGLPSNDLDAALGSINANTAFAQLKSMRESAASGASGLGQVTEKEGQMLASVISDLRPYQSTGKLKEGLARVEAAMVLLAGDDFKQGTDIQGFNTKLKSMTDEILARESNKKAGTGPKVIVRPRG